jgi:hypothetical protein
MALCRLKKEINMKHLIILGSTGAESCPVIFPFVVSTRKLP